ncbi:MAG: DUF3301 domain-containing protein [Pseudomonadales bacterium]
MYFELADLFMIAVIGAGLYYWFSAQKVRELALATARAHCQKMDLQLLDGSVSLRSLGIKRGRSGTLALVRKYRFEFSSTGAERYNGHLSMLGQKVIDIDLQAHRISE